MRSDFARRRALLFRWAIGRPRGVASVRHVRELVEWLGRCIEIRRTKSGPPRYSPRRDGGAKITLPPMADEVEEAHVTLEEIGHWAYHAGAPLPPTVDEDLATRAELTLDELRELDLEHEAAAFMQTFWVPDEELDALRCDADFHELVADSRLSEAKLQERLFWLREYEPLDIPRPEPWCAWGHFRVELLESATKRRISISRRSDGQLVTSFTVRDPRDVETSRLAVYRDLAALRPVEFELRWAEEPAGEGQDLEYHWSEFRAAVARLR